jgi:DNA repair photolyase
MIQDIKPGLLSSARQPDPWFGINYTMNLYRGCQHQCILRFPQRMLPDRNLPTSWRVKRPICFEELARGCVQPLGQGQLDEQAWL